MEAEATGGTEVEIFGGVYHLRGQNEPERLRELARYVDRRMREVAQYAASVDTGRLAILAALNIADELFQCRRRQDGERTEIEEKVAALAGELCRVLSGSDRSVAEPPPAT